MVQELQAPLTASAEKHSVSTSGAVWCMKFSLCGRLLATAGQDKFIRVWVLKSALEFFSEMRERYKARNDSEGYEMDLTKELTVNVSSSERSTPDFDSEH